MLMGRVCVATAGPEETGRKFEFKLRAVFFSLKKKLYMLMGRVCEETGRKFEFKLRAIFYLFIYGRASPCRARRAGRAGSVVRPSTARIKCLAMATRARLAARHPAATSMVAVVAR